MKPKRTRHHIKVEFTDAREKQTVVDAASGENLSASNYVRKKLKLKPLQHGGAREAKQRAAKKPGKRVK